MGVSLTSLPVAFLASARALVDTAGVRLVFATLACAWAVGCGDTRPRPRTPPRAADKAALYGDPALVPTREGEAARREVALAEELRLATEVLEGVTRVRATVSEDPPGAVVVVRTTQPREAAALQAQIEALARHVLPQLRAEHINVQVSAPAVAEAAEKPVDDQLPRTSNTALLLAVLGLGFSLGLVFDRGRSVALSYAAKRGLKASRTRGA